MESKLPTIDAAMFFACDLRVGTVVTCEPNVKARKPTYKLTVDFGALGTLTSSAQLTGCYPSPDMLIGKQVIAVVNFAPRKIADVESQCLVLGLNSAQGVIVLTPERPAENGERVF